jgi:hypothetical protein
MLPTWNPTNIKKMLPICAALVGSRKSGKSTLQSWLLENVLYPEFDLIISFCGSVSCSPELQAFFHTHGMSHMMFDEINIRFLQTLARQQEDLKLKNITRRVLILLDDCEMDVPVQQQLGQFCTRARHFNCSLISSSVSYTSISKNFRRSLDLVIFFKINMYSDKKLLLQEFTTCPKLTQYALEELEEYQCVVQEKNFNGGTFYFKIPQANEEEPPLEKKNEVLPNLPEIESEENLNCEDKNELSEPHHLP